MIYTLGIVEGLGTENITETIFYNPISEDQRVLIISGEYDQEVNGAGKLTFQIAYDNFRYDMFKAFTTQVVLYCDGDEYWRGRVISVSISYDLTKTIVCEGVLNYLLDTFVFPSSNYVEGEDVSIVSYFTDLINTHNTLVKASGESDTWYKQFIVDESLEDQWGSDTFKYVADDSCPTTLDAILNSLIDQKSGYLYTEVYETVINGRSVKTNKIYYQKILTSESNQWIAFDENMLDFEQLTEDEEFWTVIVPFGKAVDDSRVNITTVNDGKYTIAHPDAAIYGYIYHPEFYDDIEDPYELKTAAQKTVDEHQNLEQSCTVRAVDMSLYRNASPLRIGQTVKIFSKPHGLNMESLRVSSVMIDLTNPSRSEFSFGKPDKTLSKEQSELMKQLKSS